MTLSVSRLYPRWLFFSFEGITALLGGGCAFLAVSFTSLSTSSLLVAFHWDAQSSILTLSASIAAMLTGLGLWRYCTARVQWISLRRAIGTGMLFSVLAHPLAWYLTMILSFVAHLLDPSGSFGLSLDPFWAFFGSIFLSLYSLILVGWLTLLVSGISGAGLLLLLRRQNPGFHQAQREQQGHT
jgi:hypothetical protein